MALSYVALTLDLYDGQGNAVKQGNAMLTLSAQLTDTVDHEIITKAPLTVPFSGTVPPVISLVANDSANVQPQGSVWTITFNGVPGNPPGFSFTLSAANGAEQYLSAQTPLQVAPVASAYLTGSYPGNANEYLDGTGNWSTPLGSDVVSSVNGKTGAVTLSAADVGAPSSDAVVTTVNGNNGDVSLQAADVGAVPSGVYGDQMLMATNVPNGGTALVNGTPTILTVPVPNDGNLHRYRLTATSVTTAAMTGGAVNVTGMAPDGATALSVSLIGGGHAVGTNQANSDVLVSPGSTLAVVQSSALTAGASKVWVDVWEVTPQANIPTTTSSTLYFGVDGGHYASYKSVIPQTNAARVYATASEGTNGVPTAWPITTGTVPTGAALYVVSFKPDIPSLLAGTLDTGIKSWLAKLPSGSAVCMWHEANSITQDFRGNGWTATQFTQAHQRLKTLATAANPSLKVGQILLVSTSKNADSPWVTPGLDWYGLDGYGGSTARSAADTFNTSIQNVLNVVPNAKLAICETNDMQDTQAGENQFLVDAFNIAKSRNMLCFMTWWGGSTTSNPPTFDPAGFYVPTLQSLAASL